MRSTVNWRIKKRYINMILFFVLLEIIISLGLSGCGKAEGVNVNSSDLLLPDFQELIEIEDEIIDKADNTQSAVLPVKIYFDNTGSMEGYTIDKSGERNPDILYTRLIRCLRDMGRIQDAQYYILDGETKDWCKYEEGLYDNFKEKGFYVGWGKDKQGPLSKLCINGRIDANCINIILTELAEQNLNNTRLAEEIRKICENSNCETDLYAFKFEFNGPAQVPNPNAASGMLEADVHDKRPYYMIVTGPADYMEIYRKELKESLQNAELKENEDFFTVTNQIEESYNKITMKDIIFEPFADYKEIAEEIAEERKKAKKSDNKVLEEEEETTGNLGGKSKNLIQYENPEQIFMDKTETEFAAFSYQRVEGVLEKYGDWRLNFYVPLYGWEEPQSKFSHECQIYSLELPENELEGQEDSLKKWVKDNDPRIEISMEIQEKFEGESGEYPAVLYVSCKDCAVEKEHEPREHELLLLLKVNEERVYTCEKPKWIKEFDSGNTDEYFTLTYNLNGFYDVLFARKDKWAEDGMVHIQTNYAQIPILLTNLED